MILATRHGNRQVRLFESTALIPLPGSPEAELVSLREPAIRVAAVACAVRLVSETIASFVLRTYTGDASERRPVLDSPQAVLFQEPTVDATFTSFDIWSDVITGCELGEDAFLWKVKSRQNEVLELYPVDSAYFLVERQKGSFAKTIKARIEGETRDVTRNVIHVRSWSPLPGELRGAATPKIHRSSLSAARSYDVFRGRYFDNDQMPGLVIEMPGKPTKQQRDDILSEWARRHAGAQNAMRPGLVWGGMKLHFNSSMREAQGAESAEVIVRDVGRMFRIYPVELLHVAIARQVPTVELVSDMFVRFTLLSRMRRLERALAADRDLFPDRSLYPRFDVTEFLRGDQATLATVIHNLVQSGVLTKNEGRAMFGLPPIEGGDVLQETPVGGAPGQVGPGTTGGDEEDDDEDDLGPAPDDED